jgi:aromatic ring hydroxylase
MTHATMLAPCHLWAKCMCRWANMDLSIGATGLIADYNGLEHTPHIQDCMSEMAMDAEVLYSCAVAAAVEGWKHESGDRVRAFKLIEDMTASEFAGWVHAMCVSGGGAVQTFKGMAANGVQLREAQGEGAAGGGNRRAEPLLDFSP